MRLWLDLKIFGNGRGISAPFFDKAFYWLVDTTNGREHGAGQLYTFMHGLGAQLHSRQWTHPRASERRRLVGREFVVLHSSRRWGRVDVAWSMVGMPRDIDKANAAIRQLHADLGSVLLEPTPTRFNAPDIEE